MFQTALAAHRTRPGRRRTPVSGLTSGQTTRSRVDVRRHSHGVIEVVKSPATTRSGSVVRPGCRGSELRCRSARVVPRPIRFAELRPLKVREFCAASFRLCWPALARRAIRSGGHTRSRSTARARRSASTGASSAISPLERLRAIPRARNRNSLCSRTEAAAVDDLRERRSISRRQLLRRAEAGVR
jgi:hypothetical protein